MLARIPTAPIAAIGLVAGYAVAVGTGSRPAGGIVLLLFAAACVAIWVGRDGRATAGILTATGFGAFVLSHVLGLLIGAWPAVLMAAATTFAACWRVSDVRWVRRATAPPAR